MSIMEPQAAQLVAHVTSARVTVIAMQTVLVDLSASKEVAPITSSQDVSKVELAMTLLTITATILSLNVSDTSWTKVSTEIGEMETTSFWTKVVSITQEPVWLTAQVVSMKTRMIL